MKNKRAQLKGRYSDITIQQLEILVKLIKNGWTNNTTDNDHAKGKISYRKNKHQVKFDYINTVIIKGPTVLVRQMTLDDEQLDLIFNL